MRSASRSRATTWPGTSPCRGRKDRRLQWVPAVAFLLLQPLVRAEDPAAYKVIANPANATASLKKDELAQIYLKKQSAWPDGHHVVPVDLIENSPIRKRFSEQILGKSISAAKSYWQQQIFSGREVPPLEKPTGADVVQYIRSHPDALGYVSVDEPVEGVKVLTIGQSASGSDNREKP